MSRKGENIYKRRDGRWEGRYRRPGAARYVSVYGKTYREAREKLQAASAAPQSPAESGREELFAQCCDRWLAAASEMKPSTVARYRSALKCHVKPLLGEKTVGSIGARQLDEFCAALQRADSPLSPRTVSAVCALTLRILRWACAEKGYPAPQYAPRIQRRPIRETRVLTREEQSRLLRFLMDDMDDCRFGVLLALLNGLRIGEICALQWGDFSDRDATLRVTKTIQRLPCGGASRTKLVTGTPKTVSSLRTIPLSAFCVELMRRRSHPAPGAYVLTGTAAPMDPRTLQYRLSVYAKCCGLEGVHFHTLRHTFATRCIECGFETKSLSEVLGHASVQVTLDRYVHASMEFKRDNMEKFDLCL